MVNRNPFLNNFTFLINRYLFISFVFLFLLLLLVPSYVKADTIPIVSRDSIISYAATGVGSPYVWGGDKWDPANRKWGGADCSGFIIKAWQIPGRVDYKQSIGHPYNTYNLFHQNTHWTSIDRNNLAKGDILVYRSSSGGHVAMYHYGDKWGNSVMYEARSRSTGIVHSQRYFPTSFRAKRRNNLVDSEPEIIASIKTPLGQTIYAQPVSNSSSTMYFEYFGLSDDANIFNIDTGYSTQVNASLRDRSVIETRSGIINALTSASLGSAWKKNAYLKLNSGGQNIFGDRLSSDGKIYTAQNSNNLSLVNFISYFKPREDVIYLTNPSAKVVKANVLIINNKKTYLKKEVKIAADSVILLSFKKTKARFLKDSYVRINASGGRILVTKKTATSLFVPAVSSSKLSRNLFLPGFVPKNNYFYLSNPTTKRVKVSIKYINNSKSYLNKIVYVDPNDVALVDLRKKNIDASEVFVKINSSAPISVSKKESSSIFAQAQIDKQASALLYISRFNASQDFLYITNILNSSQKVLIEVYSASTLVYSSSIDIAANTQSIIDLKSSSAATFPNTQVKISSSFQ